MTSVILTAAQLEEFESMFRPLPVISYSFETGKYFAKSTAPPAPKGATPIGEIVAMQNGRLQAWSVLRGDR